MTIKNILTEPNKILRKVSLPVEKVGRDEQLLMDDMLETMYAAKGIGLVLGSPSISIQQERIYLMPAFSSLAFSCATRFFEGSASAIFVW